jgi:hypothetical protein
MEIVGLCQGDYWVMVTEWNLGDSPTGTTSTFGPFTVGVANPVPEFFTATGTASSTVCYNATNTLTVQNFMVTNAGNVELVSGSKILIQPDMVVQNGGYLRAHISASYCNSSTGCPGYTAGLTNPETLSEATSQKLTLYPNPTSGSFILARKDDQLIGTVKVEIYTMSGNLLMTCQIEGEKQQNFPSFSSMPAGIYFVKVVTDNDIETFKVMKTR